MPNKPIELPPKVAQAFVRGSSKQESSRQLHALFAFQRPRDKNPRLADVKQMFLQMQDYA
jgi:hypothetical protein